MKSNIKSLMNTVKFCIQQMFLTDITDISDLDTGQSTGRIRNKKKPPTLSNSLLPLSTMF